MRFDTLARSMALTMGDSRCNLTATGLVLAMLFMAACRSPEPDVLPRHNDPCGTEGTLTYCPDTLRGDEPTEYFWSDEPFAFRFVAKNNTGKTLQCGFSCPATPLEFGLYRGGEKLMTGPAGLCAMVLWDFDLPPGESEIYRGSLNLTREDYYARGFDFPPDPIPLYPGNYTLATLKTMHCEGIEIGRPIWSFQVLDAKGRD